MSKWLWVILILLLGGGAGYLVFYLTDSTTASYVVGVVGSAAGLASLYVALQAEGRAADIKSKLKIGQSRNLKVTSVEHKGSVPTIESDVQIDKIEDGEVRGVRSEETKD